MEPVVVSLLSAFLLSIMALVTFMWSLRKGLFVENPRAAGAIFTPGEIGRAGDPALGAEGRERLQQAISATMDKGRDMSRIEDPDQLEDRIVADRSTVFPTFIFIAFGMMWLVLGSTAGLISSLKLHWPDLMVSEAWMTFGRMRTVHLTAGSIIFVTLMVPRVLDLALYQPGIEAAKLVSLLLAGAALRLSWRPAGLILQSFSLGYLVAMMAAVGMLYTDSPLRLCNAYLLDDQLRLGYWLIGSAAVIGLAWLLHAGRTMIRQEAERYDM